MSEAEPEAQPFTLGCYASEGFHPYTCTNSLNQTVVGLLYDTLVEVDGTFQAQPCLAESVTCQISPDAAVPTVAENGTVTYPAVTAAVTTVTITVRSGVTFWNGDQLEASDVAYSLNQARKTGSIYQERLSRVTSVRYSGSQVTVKVNGAAANFDRLLDIPIIEYGTAGDALPMGTGAYQMENEGTLLRANGSWWRGEPLSMEEIPLYAAKDSDYLLYAFGGGEVSLVTTDLTGSNSLGYNGNFQVQDYPTTVMLYLGCNTETGTCAEAKVRSAIYYALDRETMAARLLSGHAQGASLPLSPSAAEYDGELAASLNHQTEQAKSLLPQRTKGLTLIVNNDSDFKTALAEELGAELNDLGLKVTVKGLSWSDYKAAVTAGEYDLYLGEVRLTADFSLDALLEEEGTLNPRRYTDPTLAYLYDAYRRAPGGEAGDAFFRELANQAPFIPVCFKSYSALYQWKTLSTLTPTQQNLFYQFYSWQFVGDEEETEEP